MEFLRRSDYQKIAIYIVTCVSVLFILKYILPYFLPLVLALFIVVPLQRLGAQREKRRLASGKKKSLRKGSLQEGCQKGVMAGGILFIVMLAIALIIVGIGTFLISRAKSVLQNAGFFSGAFSSIIYDMSAKTEEFWGLREGTLSRFADSWIDGVTGSLAQTGNGFLSESLRYLSAAGRAGGFILVSFVCVVLFAREIGQWQQGLLNLAAMEPAIDRQLSVIIRIGKKLGGMIKTYAKTQTIILVCISATAAFGLCIANIREWYAYGLLAGVMDFLPFIGTGIILIPIGVISLIKGRIYSGIAVIITYLACVMIREVLEPRLLGNGLRFSPVAVLIAVYAGVLFYGVGGVVLGPVTLLIFVELGKEIFG